MRGQHIEPSKIKQIKNQNQNQKLFTTGELKEKEGNRYVNTESGEFFATY